MNWPQALLAWYGENHRPLPWRENPDPYWIWVSELMLQQTQIVTVLPYFERWLARFPNVEALAAADLDSVRAAWAGLGYYRRARFLHEGAKYIVSHGWPGNRDEWRAVPGVGRYTAGAIASVVFGEPVAAVDGNVERVFCRVQADASVGGTRNRRAWEWASQNLHRESPGTWNQALMELGATVCVPGKPRCGECPLAEACCARLQDAVLEYPVRASRKPPINLEQQVVVAREAGRVALMRAQRGSWWEGLWHFPYEERDIRGEFRLSHVVTGHHIKLYVRLGEPLPETVWFDTDGARELALPAPHKKILEWALKD